MGVEEEERSIANYVTCVQELHFDNPFELRYHC